MSLGGCKAADVVVFRSPADQCELNGDEVSILSKRDRLRGSKKQLVIIAAVASVACIVVVVGTLVGVKFFLDTTHDIIQRKFEFIVDNTMKVQEDLTADLTDNTVQFHTVSTDSQSWLINDFNREIQILKSAAAETGSVCFVSALNRSVASSPQIIKNATPPTAGSVSSTTARYRILSASITDKSVLGKSGQELCADADTYWAEETGGKPHQIKTEREKRSAWCNIYCNCCPLACHVSC